LRRLALLLSVVPALTYAQTPEDLMDLSLEDLMNVKVTTAGKSEQSVSEATSIVSVITREEIKQSGVTTLFDFLKRIPGYFPTMQATWSTISSRGLPHQGNDHFLLLVDGHPQNSIVGQGYQQQDLLPLLDYVEQVEIIRGPGSVLWGSSAVMGIINIITRTHVDKPTITISGNTGLTGGFGERFNSPASQTPNYINYMNSIGDGKGVKGFYSLTAWQANGYRYEDNNQSAVAFPWGSQSRGFGKWPYINKQREGFEIYTKANIDSRTEITARLLKSSFNYVWGEFEGTSDARHELSNRRSYVSVKRNYNFTENFKFELNFYGDYNIQNRGPEKLYSDKYHYIVQDQSNEEFAVGAEGMGTLKVSDTNTLKVGVKVVRTKIGPNRDARLDPRSNTPIATGSDTDTNGNTFSYELPYYGVEPGIDHVGAVYAEDTQIFGNTTVFAGARAEANDYRESGVVFLPRAGVIQKITPRVTGKYIYNTGYLRPSAVYSNTVGYIVDRARAGAFPIQKVDVSERVKSHDLQLAYNTSKTYLAATLFHMSVENFTSWDANNNPQGYKKMGDAYTKGIELEARQKINSDLQIYGNASYAKGHISNSDHQGALSDKRDRTLNYPMYIANLGTNYAFNEKHSMNVNIFAWHDMRYMKGNDERPSGDNSTQYGTLGPEAYIDTNYLVKDFFAKDLDFNLFILNLTDNQDRIGMVTNNGTYRPQGRSIGARFNYEF
jgi:outer membrane receptor protein involved in Fe transport